MVEVQSQNTNGTLRFKEQPWCGKHLTNQEPVATKNVYNYALKPRSVEKTPMCRIAELARFHKVSIQRLRLEISKLFS